VVVVCPPWISCFVALVDIDNEMAAPRTASSGSVVIGSSARRLYDGKCGKDGGFNPWSDIDEYFICQHGIV
jgi:hypothetical protein